MAKPRFPLKMNRQVSWQWYRMPVILFVLGMISIVMLAWINRISERQRLNFSIVNALMGIQIETSISHLWLEEVVSGDLYQDITKTWESADLAIHLAEVILNGGESHGLIISPVKDSKLRAETEEIKSLLTRFKTIAEERYKQMETAGVGSPMEGEFDAVFMEILKKAGALEDFFREDQIASQGKWKRLFFGILFAWTLVVAAATAALWTREQRRKAAEEALETSNEQLQSQAEELSEHRLRLLELVDERTAELRKTNEELSRKIVEREQAEQAIQTLVESMVGSVGQEFFDKLANKLCAWLGCDIVVIGEILDNSRVNGLSVHVDGECVRDFSCSLAGGPCSAVVEKGYWVYPEGICKLFPEDENLKQLGAVGFIGIPLKSKDNEAIGVLYAISRMKLDLPPRAEEVLSIAAARTSAEFERRRTEKEKIKMERRLQHAQKMEAIGTLAGGIAHDFNNVLGIFMGYAELAKSDVSENPDASRNIQTALRACYRAKDLIRQILAFSRMQGEVEAQVIDIRPIIKELFKFLRASLPTTIEIHQNISSKTGMVLADPTQIHQIITNLCTNAAHAMEQTGGILEISLTDIDLDLLGIPPSSGIKPGPYIRLTVSDTGHGIDPAIQERIFDPYFTTKEVGKGTGLGLAVVHGIVKRHEGAITVHSEVNQGTVFDIYLPRVNGNTTTSDKIDLPLPRGTERILFVDDEASLVDIWQKTLEYLGYKVVAHTSSLEALEHFRAHPEDFDLVITDYTMPHITGLDLAKQMMQIRDDIPIILCTGFTEAIAKQKASEMGIRAFLMKPLDRRKTSEEIRGILDKNGDKVL